MSNKYFERVAGEIGKPVFSSKYLIVLVIAITAIGINYYYSMSMAFLTTFALAYLTKGSRSK
ncbi:hypothetical protein [Pleurocapsa sp. FMAR1]|uniref:hypothetical protein n=1 Tax=Pleurocapsa sp. FMAR1 TaxID=3040204 RepID=UPI0029C88DC2|nr:hypothetical protein [Pleurocapsa sp. FMAR1]